MAPHPAFALDRRPGGLDLGGVPEAVDEDVRALLAKALAIASPPAGRSRYDGGFRADSSDSPEGEVRPHLGSSALEVMCRYERRG